MNTPPLNNCNRPTGNRSCPDTEFNGLKFTHEELEHCQELDILSMPFYMGSKLCVLKKLIDSGADMLNLGNPELIKKICTSTNHYLE